MSPQVPISVLSAAMEPPIEPEREEARRWAAEELAKQQYAQARPSWLEELWQQFLDWLHGLDVDGQVPGTGLGIPLIGAVAVVLIVTAVILVRPRLNARRKESQGIFDEETALSAAVYRARAEAASSRSDWATAVVEQFRAVVRSAEERAVIDAQPGRTADEVAKQLGVAFSAASDRLASAAWLFDSVRYGEGASSAPDYLSLKALDKELLATRPDYAGSDLPSLAVPR